MEIGKDISAQFQALYVVHHNIPGKRVSNVSFPEHILFIPLQGGITVETKEKKYSATPGQMIYLSPNILHSFSSSSHSGERLIAMLSPHAIKNKKIFIVLPINQLIKEILFYLLLNQKTKNIKSLVQVFSKTLLEALENFPCLQILDHLKGRVMDPRVKNALSEMSSSIVERISMSEIAKRVALSTRNFNRLILKETGIQPRQWLIYFRIEAEKKLLKKPRASVTKVAFEVGYHSLSQFIAVFRAQTGQLPSDYMKHG